MAKFPEPPIEAAVRSSRPDVALLPPQTRLWRVYSSAGPHALDWHELRSYGPTDSRFDPQRPPAHHDPDRAVCYLGDRAPLCIAERFGGHRRVERYAGAPHLVGFDVLRPMRMLDLFTDVVNHTLVTLAHIPRGGFIGPAGGRAVSLVSVGVHGGRAAQSEPFGSL